MNTEYDITQVEKYFDNELSEAEATEFQDRVRTDQSFKTLVEQEKAIIQGVRLEGLARDLHFLESVEQSIEAHEKVRSIKPNKVWYYAAAAIILLIATVGLLVYSPKQSSEELFVAYFDKPYQHHAIVQSLDGDRLSLIQGNYGVPGHVAESAHMASQKHPTYFSIESLVQETAARI